MLLPELKTLKEIEDFIEQCRNIKFFPNRYRKGSRVFVVEGKKSVDSSTIKYIEDHFHQDYYIRAGHFYGIYQIRDVYKEDSKKFSPKNEETWIKLDIKKVKNKNEDTWNAETSDLPLLNSLQKTVINRYNGELKPVVHTDEEMDKLGFVKGTLNPQYWFYKEEKDYLDMYLPYKKFDCIYSKVDIKDKERELKGYGASEEEIKKQLQTVLSNNLKYGVDSLTYSAFEGLRYSFGVEIETCIGRLDNDEAKNLNLKAVHDGSLRERPGEDPKGGEYVTGVLVGDSGLNQLAEICRVLSTRCKVNALCGVHIHVGSLGWSKEDVVYAYILGEQLEDELFNMLPSSRRNNSYCRRLTQVTTPYLSQLRSIKNKGEYDIIIDKLYDLIHKEVTIVKGKERLSAFQVREDGYTGEVISSNMDNNRSSQHPNGAKCGYDKNAQRYCWLNFVTLLYNTKGAYGSNTIEIRNHSATTSFAKIKNWIKIFFAMIRFVEMNKSKIRRGKVTLKEILTYAYPKSSQQLINYVEERTQLFKVKDESVDYIEPEESKIKKTIKEVVTI